MEFTLDTAKFPSTINIQPILPTMQFTSPDALPGLFSTFSPDEKKTGKKQPKQEVSGKDHPKQFKNSPGYFK